MFMSNSMFSCDYLLSFVWQHYIKMQMQKKQMQ